MRHLFLPILLFVCALPARAQTLTSLSPATAVAGGSSFALTASGSGFKGNVKLYWNGSVRSTLVVSSVQIVAAIPAADVAAAGTAQVKVCQRKGWWSLACSASLPFTVAPPAPPPVAQLVVTTASLPAAQLGVFYSFELTAAGGVKPYTWSLQSGTLPHCLTLGADGVLSGTPCVAGSYSFIVQVTDSGGVSGGGGTQVAVLIFGVKIR